MGVQYYGGTEGDVPVGMLTQVIPLSSLPISPLSGEIGSNNFHTLSRHTISIAFMYNSVSDFSLTKGIRSCNFGEEIIMCNLTDHTNRLN